jgi:sigma-B regulation protein RsbU (phosphoserine phosphatase)
VSSERALQAFYDALLEDDAEQLYERAPCGYLSTTPDGTIIKVNQTFLALTGYERGGLIGRRRFAELLTPGGRIYHETHYAPLLQMQGAAREIALDLVCADGRRLPVLVNAVMERAPDGTPIVVRTAVFDATDRREYELELLRAKERAEESERQARLLARTLQQTLIPPEPPAIEGLDVAAAYRPAGTGEQVGGDFYDVFQLGEGDWVIAVGDVTGKGVEAAVVTALARYTIRAAAVQHPDPGDVLHALNQVMVRDESSRNCTVGLLRLRWAARDGRWTAQAASGGHPLPLLVSGGRVEPVGGFGLLIGAWPDVEFDHADVALQPGDALVLYTDGVTEARQGADFFGDEGLHASVRAHAGSAASITEGLLADVLAFQGDVPRDDIAIVAVSVP